MLDLGAMRDQGRKARSEVRSKIRASPRKMMVESCGSNNGRCESVVGELIT